MTRAKPQTLNARLGSLLATRGGRLLARLAGLALLLLVTGLVVRQARVQAFRLDAYRLGPESVRFLDVRDDVGREVLKGLYDPRRLDFSVSVFDAGAEATIRRVLARHPMIERVRSVRVRYPDRVEVRVDVRVPVAWIQCGVRDGRPAHVLLSEDARLLDPRPYARFLKRQRVPVPVVTGVTSRPPRLAGQAWMDREERVAEALAAAGVARRLCGQSRGAIVVQSIDVRDFPAPPGRRREGEVRLGLDDGTTVEWGRTERAGVASEDTYETKRWRLETQRARTDYRPGGTLDVRHRLRGERRAATDRS